jgi:hypothetical protein
MFEVTLGYRVEASWPDSSVQLVFKILPVSSLAFYGMSRQTAHISH